MLKYLISFLLVLLVSTSVNAAEGCVDNTNTNIMYTTQTGNGSYNKNTSITLSAGCGWYYTTQPVTPCTINGNIAPGYLADTVAACPIDDYVWIMLALVGGFGYLVIRYKNMRNSIAS